MSEVISDLQQPITPWHSDFGKIVHGAIGEHELGRSHVGVAYNDYPGFRVTSNQVVYKIGGEPFRVAIDTAVDAVVEIIII